MLVVLAILVVCVIGPKEPWPVACSMVVVLVTLVVDVIGPDLPLNLAY